MIKRILAAIAITAALYIPAFAATEQPVEYWQSAGTTTVRKVITRDVRVCTSSNVAMSAGVVLHDTGTVEAVDYVGSGARLSGIPTIAQITAIGASTAGLHQEILAVSLTTSAWQGSIAAVGADTDTIRADLNAVKYSTYTQASISIAPSQLTTGTNEAVRVGTASWAVNAGTATYSTNAGTAAWASAGAWPEASGDMFKSVYDPNDDGIVSTAAVANSLTPLIVATYEGVRSGTATYAVNAGTSSWSIMGGTSSWAINSGTSSWSVFGGTSSWATYSGTASWAANANDQAERSARASGIWTNEGVRSGTASYAVMGGTTAWAVNAGTATWATAGAWPTSTTDADVRISTGLIQIQLDAVALSTGAILTLAVSTGILQADLATEVSDRGIADGAIGVTTGTLRADLSALALSTGTITGYNIYPASDTIIATLGLYASTICVNSNANTGWFAVSDNDGNLTWTDPNGLAIGSAGSADYVAASAVGGGPLNADVVASSIAVASVGIEQIRATGTPSSTTFLSGDGQYRNPGAGTNITNIYNNSGNLVPIMTSDNEPSGVASAGSYFPTADAFHAFSNDDLSWVSGTGASSTTWWLQYTFPEVQTINTYAITTQADAGYARSPAAWTISGSNDGINWTVLTSTSGILDWIDQNNARKAFSMNNNLSYSSYRILITSSTGHDGDNYAAINRWELFSNYDATLVPVRTSSATAFGTWVTSAVYCLNGGGGAAGVSTGTISKSIVITNPATAATEYSIFRAGSALKVTALHLLCRGNVITGRFMAQDANGGSGAGIDGATVLTGVVDTNVNDDGSLSAPNIDPGNYIGFRVDTITGSPTQIIATIDYHERVAGE